MARSSTSGQGRPKGVPNKENKALREMILGALDRGGGEQWLVRQMEENPSAFMTLIGKVLPTTLTSDPNAPMRLDVNLRFLDDQRHD